MATIFLNGEFLEAADARVSAFDAGLTHGVGLFETMAATVDGDCKAEVVRVYDHLDRLAASAKALRLRALLWAVWCECRPPALPARARSSQPFDPDGVPPEGWPLIGHVVFGPRALRQDRYERLAAYLRKRGKAGTFPADAEMQALAGCEGSELAQVLQAMGCKSVEAEEDAQLFRLQPGGQRKAVAGRTKPKGKAGRKSRRKAPERPAKVDPNSPFAVLENLVKVK